MNIFYDGGRDYAEIFFKKSANYGDQLDELVTIFKSEKSDKIVGYGFEDASKTLFEQDLLSPAVKLAALLRILRAKEDLTQVQAAKKIGDITFRHYQRLESGEENPTLGTIASMMAAFPNTDFSVILKHKSSAA
jgi:DNA-binding XRE family transcriptional regulator